MCNRVTEVWFLVVSLPPPSTRTRGVVVLFFLSKPRCRPCKELISLFVETTADTTAVVVAVAIGGVILDPFVLSMWGTGGNLHVQTSSAIFCVLLAAAATEPPWKPACIGGAMHASAALCSAVQC